VNSELQAVSSIEKEYGELPEIFCHPGQVNLVFMNLLINAGQAVTPPGRITLTSRHDDDYVYVAVTDDGCGIPEELGERIFEPFFTTREVGKGTGLGLSISSDIVVKHGGELQVTSRVGAGTTFTVKLPRTQETP
jgi:two-component system, NtrC family, sensor kinase